MCSVTEREHSPPSLSSPRFFLVEGRMTRISSSPNFLFALFFSKASSLCIKLFLKLWGRVLLGESEVLPKWARCPSKVGEMSFQSGRDVLPKWARCPSKVGEMSFQSGRDVLPKWARCPSKVGEKSFQSGRDVLPKWARCPSKVGEMS
nr:hypothetical protein BgiMline_012048 [Biomphalaria glabrata]